VDLVMWITITSQQGLRHYMLESSVDDDGWLVNFLTARI
jgi:hypothetical protein